MVDSQLRRALDALHSVGLARDGAAPTDGQLLESYVRGREEAAFAALVQRHGPMVWGVCRRLLPSHQDAEDAFQATFLVLVRKAASVVPREMVANWLYGVAHQTALKARATAARRGAREKQVTAMPEPALEQPDVPDDLGPLLDQELSRLPDKYRAVIVLCDLEGKTRKEAARQLRVPEGTVASRQATARARLARRLARHGPPLSGGALAAALAQSAASAGVPVAVTSAAIRAAGLVAAGQAAAPGAISVEAAALAEGVLRTMLLTKLKIASAVLAVVALLGAGVVALTQHVQADGPAGPPVAQKPAPAEKPPAQQAAPKQEAAARPAEARKDAEAPPQSVRGVVKAVSPQTNSLTVTQSAGEGTYSLAPDAVVTIDGKPGALSALPPGADVTLGKFVDARTAGSLQASGRNYFGAVVKAVDAAQRTITIATREGDRTFAVSPAAFISADGKACPLSAVPAGARVNLGLLVDQQTVCGIGAEGEPLGDCGGSPIKAVDVEKRTITFDDKASPALAGKAFVVGKNANITIDGKGGADLAALPPGSYITAALSLDGTTVGSINANGPPVECDCGGSLVKAVDAERRTLTCDDKAAPAVAGKTFTVAADALIIVDGRGGAKLADVPTGAYVSLRLRVDQQTVGTVNANGPGLVGVVKAVDAEKGTVTVDETTYPVPKDAIVVIDGKPGPLAALPVGAGVNVNLRVDGRTVGMLQTRGQ
jgi:RNA polymerase sigma factor (sigma-70 family)